MRVVHVELRTEYPLFYCTEELSELQRTDFQARVKDLEENNANLLKQLRDEKTEKEKAQNLYAF